MPDFCHLHCHTQFSLLDGASDIGVMMDKAVQDGQKGVALTDHGNMFGAFKFVAEAGHRGLKPIVGCEFYMVENRHKVSFSKARGERDNRYHQLLLAKNAQGYRNLSKLCSLGFIEGLYGKYPRIDKELLLQYHEGLIATSCCIGAEIPQAILHGHLEKADELVRWWLNVFGEDFYIELQRHRGLENIDRLGISQEDVNQTLLQFAKKYNIKVIATNDSHYVNEEDAPSHDLLLCINTGNKVEDTDRFRFPSADFYFKTKAEMSKLFADVPQAVETTIEIFDKVEKLKLARDILLPAFPLPKGVATQEEYLRQLTYEGMRRRYSVITPNIRERVDFELDVITKTGYSGYFLIVQDFTTAARQMGVMVGPGRGSAAGAAVSYCLGITNIDPIKYDLLFERFLNPERVSMPDVDIDFDDEGRQRIIDYVIEKYGKNQVAQIVTYGSMAAKSSIKDVGRVMNIPLNEVENVTKAFPAHLKASLKGILAKGDVSEKLKSVFNAEDLEKAYKIRQLADQTDEIGEMLRTAKRLEGSVRNTGIHACGIVITPDDITNYVPVKVDKESEMLITQFDNSVAEEAGLLKMDFLGLKTLTIIRDAIQNVRDRHGFTIDPDAIPLDDPNTYQLFQRGDTVGIFQYESTGMQKYMRDLRPTEFRDLIAMNALYRPGPLEYIPEFVERKHGRKPVVYDLPAMEEYLSETYGITVYQEQVMLLSQKLAGFTKGEADMLRKGMGKKKKDLIDKLFPKFIAGGTKNGHPQDILEKVWKDWEAFASYAFNKSHSTCYAYVAFQTAYLKANHPAEFMASVLTHNRGDLSKVTFFLDECRRMGVAVLGPDINESEMNFTVNKKGQIRFGLSALKGVGDGPVENILEERKRNGRFDDVFDFVRRMSGVAANKKVMESLAYGGGFDCFENIHRAQYFAPSDKHESFIAHLLRYGTAHQQEKSNTDQSLFGGRSEGNIPPPAAPKMTPWTLMERLENEKEVIGIYISGHPLDDYRIELEYLTSCSLDHIEEQKGKKNIKIGGMVIDVQHRTSQKGTGWGVLKLQDFGGTLELRLFGEDYAKFKHFLNIGEKLFLVGNYEKSWKGEEFEFRPVKVNLLETVGKELIESITLHIELSRIDPPFIDSLRQVCHHHQGDQRLRMAFFDQGSQIKLDLASRNTRVSIDQNFTRALRSMGVGFQLN